jgi:hypothetical protein
VEWSGPALTTDELADLEAYLGVALPEEYRSFLTEVGGAGPTYGVFPVRREPAGTWRWHGDGADLTSVPLLATPFPVQRPRTAETRPRPPTTTTVHC